MQPEPEFEQEIISATQSLAYSINSAPQIVADISALIEATARLPLSNLDYWERLIERVFSSALPSRFAPVSGIRTTPQRFLTWIDLCSSNGYEREKTLRCLSGAAPNGFFLALAIRRLNDWVPQVRQAARAIIPPIAHASHPEHVVDAVMAVLAHWDSWGRMETSDKRILLDIISDEKITVALRAKMMSATTGGVSAIFVQLGRTPTLDHCLIDIAQNARQPAIRAKAYRSLFEGKMRWIEERKREWIDIRYCKSRLQPVFSSRALTITSPFNQTLRMAAADRSFLVRRIAAEMLIRNLDNPNPESWELAKRFAADPSPSVARRGLFALKSLEGSDKQK